MYRIDENTCTGCAACMNICPANAIYMIDNTAYIDEHRCNGCGRCVTVCPKNAIHEKEPVLTGQVPINQTKQNGAPSQSSSSEYPLFPTLMSSFFEDFFVIPFGGLQTGSKRFGCARRERQRRCGRRR